MLAHKYVQLQTQYNIQLGVGYTTYMICSGIQNQYLRQATQFAAPSNSNQTCVRRFFYIGKVALFTYNLMKYVFSIHMFIISPPMMQLFGHWSQFNEALLYKDFILTPRQTYRIGLLIYRIVKTIYDTFFGWEISRRQWQTLTDLNPSMFLLLPSAFQGRGDTNRFRNPGNSATLATINRTL